MLAPLRPAAQPATTGSVSSVIAVITVATDIIVQGQVSPWRAAVETETEVEEKIKEAFGKGWAIIVWNDPTNLMSYVAHVFQIVLKMSKEDANRHMLEVHNRGKSVVGIETREQAEFLVHRLQSYGLHATMEAM
ncbi:ATP-dependent Clp protease adapter ClpS [Verrucomicrobia bacterium LW23]|nr:ATP-dependent Clp protease adapter ClpS [Verrucomicrobia bacterium LW23]